MRHNRNTSKAVTADKDTQSTIAQDPFRDEDTEIAQKADGDDDSRSGRHIDNTLPQKSIQKIKDAQEKKNRTGSRNPDQADDVFYGCDRLESVSVPACVNVRAGSFFDFTP